MMNQENLKKKEIRKRLKKLLVEELALQGIDPEDLADNERLFDGGLELDSLDAVEIAVILQRSFDLEVKDAKLGRRIFQTIDTLTSWIYEKQESR